MIAATTPADFNPERSAAEYYSKPVHHRLELAILNRLIADHTVYFISARSFPNAIRTTQHWLALAGVNIDDCAGVLCGEGTRGTEHKGSDSKHTIIEWLGCDLHIDDHSSIVPRLGRKGVLFYNPNYPENVKAYYAPNERYRTATSWQQIDEIVKELDNKA